MPTTRLVPINFTKTSMTALDFSKVGFIGLGAMGKHMVEHLATKLPNDSCIFVYDISSPPIDELVSRYPGKIIRNTSPRNVADNSVCPSRPP